MQYTNVQDFAMILSCLMRKLLNASADTSRAHKIMVYVSKPTRQKILNVGW